MSSNFGYIDIILLAMIAGFIILRLRSILGRKTGHEDKIYPRFSEKKFEEFGLEKIKTVGDAIVAVAGLSSHAISPVKSCVDCSYKLREIANSADMPWDVHLGIHSGPLVAGTVGTKTVQFDILGKTVNIAFNICDMSDANQILISSDAWMTARNEIKVKSIGLKRLKSGQDIEMLECV